MEICAYRQRRARHRDTAEASTPVRILLPRMPMDDSSGEHDTSDSWRSSGDFIDVAAAVAFSCFARSSHAWFVVDRDARILYRNQIAQTLLVESAHFNDRDGVLHVASSSAQMRLLSGLADATSSRARHDPPAATGLTIPRAGRQLPYIVLIAPIDIAAVDIPPVGLASPDGPSIPPSAPLATATIIDPSRRVDEAASLLARLFDLSDAERRVAVGVANGARLADIADAAAVRPSTIRSQLKAVLRKTGARHQSDVVRLVHNLLD